jgi:hypothetical protein
MFMHSLPNSQQSSVVSQALPEPLLYYRIDTNIEHEAGESPPLRNTPSGAKRLPKIAPSMTNHLCIVPELFLEAQQIWTHPIPCQDF